MKELEKLGIGRPSTYAAIISVLADRRYVLLEQRRFFPTELGETVEKVMVKQFPDVFNVRFTSEMEQELDKIEEGDLSWRRVLEDFYTPFAKSLAQVDAPALIAAAHDLSSLATVRCPECGEAGATRWVLWSLPRLRESSQDVQVHAPDQGREGEAQDDQRALSNLWAADGGARRAERGIPRVQHLSQVSWYALHAHGSFLSQGWGGAGAASFQEARHGILCLFQRDVRLCGVEQAGEREVSGVRLCGCGDEVQQDARGIPKVPQMWQ